MERKEKKGKKDEKVRQGRVSESDSNVCKCFSRQTGRQTDKANEKTKTIAKQHSSPRHIVYLSHWQATITITKKIHKNRKKHKYPVPASDYPPPPHPPPSRRTNTIDQSVSAILLRKQSQQFASSASKQQHHQQGRTTTDFCSRHNNNAGSVLQAQCRSMGNRVSCLHKKCSRGSWDPLPFRSTAAVPSEMTEIDT